MHLIQILNILVFGFIFPPLNSKYILVQLQDNIIGYRNQGNGVMDRIGKIRPRDDDQNGVLQVPSDACENVQDNLNVMNAVNCSSYLEQIDSYCKDFSKLKFCDSACNLCECSTGTGIIREHCSGRGTCRADCTQNPCTNAKCECYPGWSGDVCQTQIQCTPKDSDTCIQNVEGWDDYNCGHLKQGAGYHQHCDDYPKVARRCCPEACENLEEFTESVCIASKGSDKCIYPNEAQCSESYTCKDGQGEDAKEIMSLQVDDITKCKENCTNNLECMGFDFTTNDKPDSCRLYPANNEMRDAGLDERKYCKKTEGNGKWGEWKDWEDCPVSCGGAYQKRIRLCDSPAPQFGHACTDDKVNGKKSSGYEVRRCNGNPCPIFIVYSCEKVFCNLTNYQKDEDYGIYHGVIDEFKNDCQECKDKCSSDPNCGGVQCQSPDGYCRWWKQGKCVTEDEREENPAYKTCIKFRAECGKHQVKKTSSRIFGGEEAAKHSIPWQVAIMDKNVSESDPECGGTLISQIHVLSAAHCFEEPSNLSRYQAIFEIHELHEIHKPYFRQLIVRPSHISIHPSYKKLCGKAEIPEWDFSILHFRPGFKKNIPLNKKLIPACLPDDSMGGIFLEGKDLTVSGWGEPFHDSLHKATIPGASNDDCKTYIDGHNCNVTVNSTNMMCAGNLQDRKVGDGVGDSGGPLTYNNNGRETVVGVVSWSESCAFNSTHNTTVCNDTLSVYARVTAVLEWIKKEIEITIAGGYCTTDEDCAEGVVCDLETNACTGCDIGGCPVGQHCPVGYCTGSTEDCITVSVCVPGCAGGSDCGLGKTCDWGLGICVDETF